MSPRRAERDAPGRHRVPVLLRRPRRRPVPRARPGGGADRARAHVSVLAPADDDTPIPEYMTAAGRAIPVRYNGAVARMTFGPVTAARVRKWLAAGEFDVLHLHEPVTPSLGMLALWIADGPIVATFHTALIRSRPLQMAYPLVRQSLEKISARIAVSEDARRTLVEHMGGDAVVIPNGVYVDAFTDARARPALDRHARASDHRVPRAARRGAQGAAGPARGRAPRARRASRARGSSSRVAARPGRTRSVSCWATRRRPPSSSSAGSPTRTRPTCWRRSTCTAARRPAARASASCSSRR